MEKYKDNNLRNFISKLNDRNLQRKRESGYTSYALYTVLFLFSYKLYNNIILYYNNSSFDYNEMLHITCFTLNILVSLRILYGTVVSEKRILSNWRVIKYSENKNIHSFILSLFMFDLPFVILIFSLILSNGSYLLYYLFLILLYLTPYFYNEEKNFTKKKINLHSPTNLEFGVKIIFTNVSLLVIILSILLIINSATYKDFALIKVIILSYSILFILSRILNQEILDITTRDIESFEYEIYLKDLSDEEIRDRMYKNFIGYSIDYWIDMKKNELISFKKKIEDKINTIKEYNSKQTNGDTFNEYSLDLQQELQSMLYYFEETLSQVRRILKDKVKLSKSENEELIKLEESLIIYINDYKDYEI